MPPSATTETLTAALRVSRGDFNLNVTCTVPAVGVTGVFGPSGAGKSTLLRCLAGLEAACEGELRLGTTCWQDSARGVLVPAHLRGVGVVFQDSRLFSHLDVRGNLEYGYRRAAASERRIGFDEVVHWLDLAPLLTRAAATLSGGERQRVALGRSLLAQPRLLLLDEPLAALDQRRKQEMLPYLIRLRALLALPIFYVSHDLDELVECADHLLLLEDGKVGAAGPLAAVLARADLRLAQDDDAGAVIATVLAEHDDAYHLSHLGLGAQHISVARQSASIGTQIRLRIRARDVALSMEAPRHTTLLNILVAHIDALVPAAQPGQVMVKLDLEGQTLLARITQKSAAALALRGGMKVYALIKSVALMR